jgi:uracil phosphoribosyltransferase
MFVNLGEQSSIFNQFIAEIRDKDIQKDSLRFRRNLERIGEIFAYEISRRFQYVPTEVQTPLGTATVPVMSSQPVVSSILRAGLPIHQGFLNVLDTAENIFITAYRKYEKDGSFQISFENISGPWCTDKDVIPC